MSFAGDSILNDTSAANEVSGTGVTSWKRIFDGLADLMENCVTRQETGGAVVLFSGKWIRAHNDAFVSQC